MSIVLLEATDAGQTREGTGQFVAVQDTKVSKPNGQIAPRANRVGKHEAMTGTVHWFHSPFLAFNVKAEHGILVVQGVARLVPQIEVVNIGSNDFRITSLPVVVLDEFNQFVVDASSVWEPKGATGGKFVEHDKVLLGGNATVVAFFGLFLILLPHLEHLLVWKTDTVHALQGVILGITEPIGGGMSSGSKGLDLACGANVWTTAQVNQITTSVDCGASTVSHLGLENLYLEGVVSKEFQTLFFGNDHAFELLLRLDDFADFCFDGFVIFLSQGIRSHEGIVIESTGEWGSDGEFATIQMLQGFSEHVC
mmetsp:Transcript_3789/g.6313  ORF Transcript_3789/g.6313 Transcript_3789/m.6313 type:complete len:309 (-) Transcript_3789:797-1723(-)